MSDIIVEIVSPEIVVEVVPTEIVVEVVPTEIVVLLANSGPMGPMGPEGPEGPIGPTGLPGADANAVSQVYTSGENLGGHRAVVIGLNAQVFYADHDILDHAFRVRGITTGSTSVGADATVQISGVLTEPTWSWIVNTPVWLGSNGLLTQAPPSTGFSLVIGVAVTSTSISIQQHEPIILT